MRRSWFLAAFGFSSKELSRDWRLLPGMQLESAGSADSSAGRRGTPDLLRLYAPLKISHFS